MTEDRMALIELAEKHVSIPDVFSPEVPNENSPV